jgi:hypothetical protein
MFRKFIEWIAFNTYPAGGPNLDEWVSLIAAFLLYYFPGIILVTFLLYYFLFPQKIWRIEKSDDAFKLHHPFLWSLLVLTIFWAIILIINFIQVGLTTIQVYEILGYIILIYFIGFFIFWLLAVCFSPPKFKQSPFAIMLLFKK